MQKIFDDKVKLEKLRNEWTGRCEKRENDYRMEKIKLTSERKAEMKKKISGLLLWHPSKHWAWMNMFLKLRMVGQSLYLFSPGK